jgi:hypothetical protein
MNSGNSHFFDMIKSWTKQESDIEKKQNFGMDEA